MTIKETELGTEIYADDGKAICPKDTYDPVVESVLLSPSDSPDRWMDCDKDGPSMDDEVTVEDKDAALRRFGVEV